MAGISCRIRDMTPCNGCTEKFLYCHSQCPKDARGEPGYAAWRAEVERVNAARREYMLKPYVRNYGK